MVLEDGLSFNHFVLKNYKIILLKFSTELLNDSIKPNQESLGNDIFRNLYLVNEKQKLEKGKLFLKNIELFELRT